MGERVAILGMGLSGQAAAELAWTRGDCAVTFDASATADHSDLTEADLTQVDRIILSPGLAEAHPWRQKALASGKPCLGEVGYAAEVWRGQIYGVTGTNGKTSLTRLLTDALRAAGVEAIACGNIGTAFASVASSADNSPDSVAVCELSSFQAELCEGLKLDALLWTNFAPDHLDRYGNAQDYFMAKWALTTCLRPGSPFIYEAGIAAKMDQNGVEATGRMVQTDCIDPAGLPDDSPFLRPPQQANLALAQALWEQLGQDAAALQKAAAKFTLPEHRLQRIAVSEGVTYWNDSKATNFHAVQAALAAMPKGSVIWVGGGRSKGEDPARLVAHLKGRIAHACVYGECAAALGEALEDMEVPQLQAKNCGDAIQAAARLAREKTPAHLLFSPGFASFDAFTSYAERGKYFNSVVLGL